MKATILKTNCKHMVFNTHKYRCKCMHYVPTSTVTAHFLKPFSTNEHEDPVEKLLILGLGHRKHNKPYMPCDRLRNCSFQKDIEAT